MAGIDDIVQTIVITGNDDVAAAFEKMREAGEKAFDGIERAAEHSVFSITGIATAAAGIAAAFAAVSVGVFAFEKSTAETTIGMEDLAKQTGATIEEIAGLKAAFANGGVGAQQLEQTFRRLSVAIQQSWSQIQRDSAESADKLKGDALAISNAILGLEQAQRNSANFSRDQANQEKQNANAVTEARLRVQELNGRDVSIERDRLQRLQARQSLQQALEKQEEDTAKAASEAQRVANAEEQAQLTLNQARRKERDDELNDIKRVTEAVKKVGEADTPQAGTEILKGINASAENIAKGIINSTKGASEALGQLKGDITDLAVPAPAVLDVFEHLGQVLRNIENPTLETAVAQRLLGRSVSQAELEIIKSTEKLSAFREHVKSLGIDFEGAAVIAKKFRDAMFSLQSDIEAIGVGIGAALGPAITKVLESLDAALLRNKDSITGFVESIANSAVPIIESFIRVLEGAPDAAKDQWLLDYKESLLGFASAVGTVVSVISAVVVAIARVAGSVGAALNSVLGTNLNAIDVLIGLFLAKVALSISAAAIAIGRAIVGIVAAQRAISAALLAGATATEAAAAGTAAAAGVMSASLLPLALTVAGLALAFVALTKGWETWKKAVGDDDHSPKLDSMLEGAKDRLAATRDLLVRPPSVESFKQFHADLKKADEEQAAREKKQDADDLERKKHNNVETKALHEDTADSAKKVYDDIVNSSKEAATTRIASDKDVAAQIRETTSETLSSFREQQKAAATTAATKKNADGSITDAAGTKIFPGASGEGIDESVLSAIQKAVAAKTGVRPEDVEGFGGSLVGGRGIPLGDPNALPFEVLHPKVIEKPPLPPVRPRPVEEQVEPVAAPAQAAAASLNSLSTAADNLGAKLNQADEQQNAPAAPQEETFGSGSAVSNFLDSIESGIGRVLSTIVDYITGSNFSGSASEAASSAESLSSALQDLIFSAQSAAAGLANLGGSGDALTAADGGHIRGPGSETSDSIFARLSDNEYVQPARATRHYGVEFMHAVRNLSFPRFNTGGLMSFSLPRFNDGGSVMLSGAGGASGMTHLGTVDLTTDHGVVRVGVDRDGLSQLRRAAVNRNLGADRKPGWVR